MPKHSEPSGELGPPIRICSPERSSQMKDLPGAKVDQTIYCVLWRCREVVEVETVQDPRFRRKVVITSDSARTLEEGRSARR